MTVFEYFLLAVALRYIIPTKRDLKEEIKEELKAEIKTEPKHEFSAD